MKEKNISMIEEAINLENISKILSSALHKVDSSLEPAEE